MKGRITAYKGLLYESTCSILKITRKSYLSPRLDAEKVKTVGRVSCLIKKIRTLNPENLNLSRDRNRTVERGGGGRPGEMSGARKNLIP